MLGVIEDAWDQFHEALEPMAANLCVGCDTPNDKLLLLFVAHKCGIINLDSDNAKYVSDMMTNAATTGNIEGAVSSALDDPDFIKALF